MRCGASTCAKASASKKSLFAIEQDRPDVARKRDRWRRHQARLDPRRLVFIDETWAKTNMTRTHGRCARGQRLVDKVPHGHWKTLTFLAAGAHLFFLPPYSPDLNPIEQVFAKLKTLLRKAAERSVEDTWRRIGQLLEHFTAAECANYLVNSGFAPC